MFIAGDNLLLEINTFVSSDKCVYLLYRVADQYYVHICMYMY